jgi:hypothetical protein
METMMGEEVVFPEGIKRPRREAASSPPSSTEVKKWWNDTYTPTYIFMTLYVSQRVQNFTFTFLTVCGGICSTIAGGEAVMQGKRSSLIFMIFLLPKCSIFFSPSVYIA